MERKNNGACIRRNLGFCRGMQMLAVVSGAEMFQDIPTHFQNLNKEYLYQHRNEKVTPNPTETMLPMMCLSPMTLSLMKSISRIF